MLARTRVAALTVVAVLVAGPAAAGGLYLTTYGTPDMARASAGTNSDGNDAATALHNPAAMTRLDDHAFAGSLAPGFTNTKFDVDENPLGGGNGGQQGAFVPIMTGQYVHKLSERFRLGLALFSMSGASLDPNDGWAGRQQLSDVSLLTLTIAPTVAVELSDWFSVGVGAWLSFGKLGLDLRVPFGQESFIKLRDMDDFAAAPVASMLITPTENLRFGVLYQGATNFELNGDISFRGQDRNLKLDFPLAQAVRTSATWDVAEPVTLQLSVGWEDWSVSKSLPLQAEGASANVPLEFSDTWYLAGGVQYRPCEGWEVETGLRYDSSAPKTRDRTAALPIDRVYTVGVGTNWDYSEHLNLGFAFTYANLGKAPIDKTGLKGHYKSNDLFLFGVSLRWDRLPWSGKFMI